MLRVWVRDGGQATSAERPSGSYLERGLLAGPYRGDELLERLQGCPALGVGLALQQFPHHLPHGGRVALTGDRVELWGREHTPPRPRLPLRRGLGLNLCG